MIPFDYQPRTRIVFGPGSIHRLGELASELGARRVLVVSDSGLVSAGHTSAGMEALAAAGIEAHLFHEVRENPTTDDVANGVRMAKRYEPELIVGLGGGSSMDCAKGINFVHSNGGTMHDYWGVDKALRPMLPMIAVPTTSGTGSETQSFALISDSKSHVKMACGDKKAAFRVALLDPELTLTQPRHVTALTGIDAISHAVESYVTTKRKWISSFYGREAFRLLALHFPQVMADPSNLEARGGMQLGASLAGLAIENSMLGATHALANPLTAHYRIVHGQAVGTMLPHVVRFNGEVCGALYRELLLTQPHEEMPSPDDQQSAADQLAELLANLVEQARLSLSLSEQGVDLAKLPDLAEDAAKQWTGTFNPRPVDAGKLLGLYQAAFTEPA